MSKILKFSVFESFNLFGSKILSDEEFKNLLEENCKNWIDNFETKNYTPLYRGQPNLGKLVFTDPTRYKRNSIEDTNLHLELMDNLPSWKDYPKYSRSVIGISSYRTASSYSFADNSTTYEIIPYDNTKIGICPSSAIWSSFGNSWGQRIYSTKYFLEELKIEEEWINSDGETIKTKLESIKSFTSKIFESDYANNFLHEVSLITGIDVSNITGEDCYNFINDYFFNPEKNYFKLLNYTKGFKITPNRQIWTSGPVLLIETKK